MTTAGNIQDHQAAATLNNDLKEEQLQAHEALQSPWRCNCPCAVVSDSVKAICFWVWLCMTRAGNIQDHQAAGPLENGFEEMPLPLYNDPEEMQMPIEEGMPPPDHTAHDISMLEEEVEVERCSATFRRCCCAHRPKCCGAVLPCHTCCTSRHRT